MPACELGLEVSGLVVCGLGLVFPLCCVKYIENPKP